MHRGSMFKLKDFWFKIPEKIRFVFVGGFNSLVSFILFVFLLHFFAQYFINNTLWLYNWLKSHFELFHYINLPQFVRQLSLILAWFLSSFVSFTTQRHLVFRARKNSNIYKQYSKCLSTWFVGYIVNAVILEILASYFEKVSFFPPIIESDIAQAFALIISAIVTYCLFKYFAFKVKPI